MPYSIRTKDGIVVNNIPDDIPEDHPSLKQRVNRERIAMQIENDPISQGARDPTKGIGGLENFNAGIGKSLTDLGRGAAQMVGMGPSADDVRETRRLDAPLMNNAFGAAGNVAGNIAAFAPLAVVPGANAVAGAGALGAATGAFQPTEGTGERLSNMAKGGALGASVQAAAGPIARKLGEWGADRQAQMALKKSQGALADETLARGQQAGYVLPPSAVNESWLGKRLESIAGKSALSQEAAIRNQPVTDALAREAASLRPEQPISKTNLRAARQELSGPYREVAALSPQAEQDLKALQQARFDSKTEWKYYNRSAEPEALQKAMAADTEVKRLQERLTEHASAAGKDDLVDALVQARSKLAQNHQVQKSMNAGTGSVDASVIGRDLDNGAKLSGPLETIGRFQQAYKPYTREASTVPTPGVSKSEALASALLATTGHSATGNASGLLAGGLPMLSGPMRSFLLSKIVQEAAAKPNYSAGALPNAMSALADPESRRRTALLARALALPAIPSVTPSN